MNIFDKFDSRDELLRAVEESIVSEQAEEGPDGTAERFYLKNDAAAETEGLHARLEAEAEETRQLRQRLAAAESRAEQLAKENARLAATNEEFSNYNPEKQRDEINRLLEEVGRLKADNNGLAEQIEPLNRLIADYKRKEDERTIDQALIDEAARLGVRPEAMRARACRMRPRHLSMRRSLMRRKRCSPQSSRCRRGGAAPPALGRRAIP